MVSDDPRTHVSPSVGGSRGPIAGKARRPVLVFGGAGWTGQSLLEQLAERGTTAVAPRSGEVDVADAVAVHAVVERVCPAAIVNLAAAQPGASESDLSRVNVDGAHAVASAAAKLDVPLVHVASDVVFDGSEAPYDEGAPVRPLTPYGRSKAAGEAAVLAACPGAVSVRTSLIWDPAAIDRGTAGFARRLASGEPCRLFTDEIRCPIPRGVLAACLVRLIEIDRETLNAAGPLHIAGSEPLSRHAFGTLLLSHFGVAGRDRVVSARAADLEAAGGPRRPRDLRLDCSRACALLDVELPGVSELVGPR